MASADLVEELLARPDDLELRLVLADRLQDAGDLRGELMAVQCALAAERAPVVRARLRAREAAFVRGGLVPELGAAIGSAIVDLEWRLGFLVAATVLDRPCELVPALLAHPAARLIEELTVSIGEGERAAAVGALIHARPRPSLLRRVNAGSPGPGRRWIEHDADPVAFDPLSAAAPGIEVRTVRHVSQAAFEAEIEGDTEEHRNELWILQIAPPVEGGDYQAVLRVRAGCEDELAALHGTLSSWARSTLAYDPRAREVRIYHASDRTYVGYANLYRALRAIAPFLEDARFTISESYSSAVDELAIADGELGFVRGFAAEDTRAAKRDYWYGRLADRPRDEELRRFVARLYADHAEFRMRHVERLAPNEADPDGRRDEARGALERALSLDDRNPEIWRLRGRLARAVGDLADAERSFAREQELGADPAAGFDLALAAFAAGQDAAARERIERAVAGSPDRTAALLVAGFLADRAGAPAAAHAHLGALVRTVERRRAATITPLDEHQRVLMWGTLESGLDELVQTGRHAELVDWYVEALAVIDRGDPALVRGAAAHLLSCAEHFRIRIAHGRQPEESARIAQRLYAAAEALDPLAGSVSYARSLFDRRGVPHEEWRRARSLGRANLERALAINPDHLDALGDLAGVHRDLGEHDRAIELLERYMAVFSALHRSGGARGYQWDLRVNELAHAHHERACRLLYGVPPGANPPPGRPGEAALAEADAAADRGLDALGRIAGRHPRERVPFYLLKASVAGFRAQHADALAWADRALAADDQSPHAWSAHASSAKDLGRLDDAATSAQLALDLDEDHWHAHYVLACVEARRGGDRGEILRRLGRVLALWPEGGPELAAEPDLAPLRGDPAFRALIGA